jgi:hypothetical protein
VPLCTFCKKIKEEGESVKSEARQSNGTTKQIEVDKPKRETEKNKTKS